MTDLFTEPYQLQLARKRLRVFAAIVDYLLVWGFMIFIGVTYGERYDTEEGGVGFRLSGEQSLLCFGFWFVMLPLLEGLKGQTIGKMLFKIQQYRSMTRTSPWEKPS